MTEERAMGDFSVAEEVISDVCGKYENVTVIPGLSLVPHDSRYYGDLRLHPNDSGFEYYFKNLKEIIGG